jgi:hypothetical protein
MGHGHVYGRTRLSFSGAVPALLGLGLGGGTACSDEALILPSPGAAVSYTTAEGGTGGEVADPGAEQLTGSAGSEQSSNGKPEPPPAASLDAPPTNEHPDDPAGAVEPSGNGPAPALRGSVVLADEPLARQALELLGSGAVGATGSCSGCHSLGRPTLTRWLSLTRSFGDACLSDPALPDAAAADVMLRCFDQHAAPEAELAPATFGIYAAAAHLPWFSFVFEHTREGGVDRHDDFITSVAMPRAGRAWTQEQFDIVAEWFARGLPYSFELVPEDSGGACSGGVDPRLAAHVALMRQSGWRARNDEAPLLMFGCDGGAPASCLSQLPLAAETLGQSWDTGAARIRILKDNSDTPSNYWSRCSADGRYIASGVRGNGLDYHGQFVDLEGPRTLAADFSYDPTFFPDNSGFLVQRAGYDTTAGGVPVYRQAAIACNQSVLAGDSEVISGSEPECDEVDGRIGLYQQVGKSLDGEDHWVVFGSFVDDNGGISPTLENPSAAFESRSAVSFTPLINRGASFEPGPTTVVSTPLAGDPMLSPSGRLLVTRVKGLERSVVVDGQNITRAEQSGYSLMLVTTTGAAETNAVTLAEVGRICAQGGKPAISYDERWMVLHHYVTDDDATALGFSGVGDPGFASYRELGASNLVLVDLLDGSSRTITRMGAGQYALFPHFRSDGWIYFVVRTLDREEYFAASDAAVLLDASGAEPPAVDP